MHIVATLKLGNSKCFSNFSALSKKFQIGPCSILKSNLQNGGTLIVSALQRQLIGFNPDGCYLYGVSMFSLEPHGFSLVFCHITKTRRLVGYLASENNPHEVG